jgi:hypothetical protein
VAAAEVVADGGGLTTVVTTTATYGGGGRIWVGWGRDFFYFVKNCSPYIFKGARQLLASR